MAAPIGNFWNESGMALNESGMTLSEGRYLSDLSCSCSAIMSKAKGENKEETNVSKFLKLSSILESSRMKFGKVLLDTVRWEIHCTVN